MQCFLFFLIYWTIINFDDGVYSRVSPSASEKKRLRVARLTGIIFGGAGIVFALLLATLNIMSLFDYFNFVLGLLTSGLGGLFVMGISFPRIDGRSALIGFVTGTALLFYLNIHSNMSFWLYGAIGIASSVLIALLLSIIVPGRSKPLDKLTWGSRG